MGSKGVRLDTAVIVSTMLEGILYGFSVLLFIGTIWAVVYKHRGNRPIAVVAFLLFILSTTHIVVAITRMERGLVEYRDSFPGGPVAYLADVSQTMYVIKCALYVLQTLLGDGAVIYRCYVVWQSVWVIILPSMLWCSSAVTAFYSVYNFSQGSRIRHAGSFDKATEQLNTAFLASTLSTHLICSGLLVFRIWMIERNGSTIRNPKSTTMPILRALVDDALYSVALMSIIMFFVFWNKSNAQHIILDMVMPLISICFYMVLIRIAISRKTHCYLPTVHGGTANETERMSRQHPMKPLQVHISQFTYSDGASTYETGNKDRPGTCKVECVEGASCDV
ncbi:hypothetical protein DEU56DRAFT_974687 [Suillus clintonianus]|uniref:uncharacterized protein n=1 Tax=Suillus clintonianus TaxID=1904413 RepID=UPI001B864575|nr:uncharacterized protein DEU56DRAFT_974687 [Suillus clintonianus]KAG2121268.1 hypothetical protein DEU56DRAFT_974687 [Suillus clintonianus]